MHEDKTKERTSNYWRFKKKQKEERLKKKRTYTSNWRVYKLAKPGIRWIRVSTKSRRICRYNR